MAIEQTRTGRVFVDDTLERRLEDLVCKGEPSLIALDEQNGRAVIDGGRDQVSCFDTNGIQLELDLHRPLVSSSRPVG